MDLSARISKMLKRRISFYRAPFARKHIKRLGIKSHPMISKATPVNVAQMPGLNTLGISMVRLDFAPWGVNPPHTHPRTSDILTVLEGVLVVGFVTSNPESRLISKVLSKGDIFMFPMGLVHFQRNVGNCNVVAIAALSSQNPGAVVIANVVLVKQANQ